MNLPGLPRRMRWQLTLLLSGVLMCALAVLGALTLNRQVATARADIENQANALLRNLAVASANPTLLGSLDELDDLLRRSVEFPGVLDLQIVDAQGRSLSHVRRAPDGGVQGVIDPPQRRLALPTGPTPPIAEQRSGGRVTMVGFRPIVGGRPLGWVRGEFATDELDQIRTRILWSVLVSAGLAVGVGSSLLYLVLRRPMRALEHARRFAVALDRSEGRSLELLPAPVEIEDLQRALGHASERLHAQRQELATTIQQLRIHQAALEERNELLDAIFTLSPDGFVSFDAAHCVNYVSRAFLALSGLAEAELAGLHESAFFDLLRRASLAPAAFPDPTALDLPAPAGGAGPVRRHLVEMAAPARRVLEIGLRRSRIASVSQVLYVRDVTHESAVDRMKSEFLSTAAHELRTPMASIYGFAELLLHRDYEPAARRELVQTIHRQSELVVYIVNELLDLARIESRRGQDLVYERLLLDDLVGEAVAAYKTPAGRAPPRVEHDGNTAAVKADRKKMLQVALNILSNAYKYSNAGEVLMAARRRCEGGRDWAGIAVRDHGIGMTPEQSRRVGERFYRADASGNVPGTGLGMSIVKELVELQGGKVELQSEPGVGTTVTLWLPLAAA
ncbi:MAG: hypothetical protein KGL43_00695 [Burkholderiales bacterium]|nr:hypothetical protein [Burkholderiales bacterium]MDE2452084.1 hypothetical protein [Burkholderiales bacterium]